MSETKPAMTAEEWGEFFALREAGSSIMRRLGKGGWTPPENAHKQAALCLHNQPFGFTREMAEAARWQQGYWEARATETLDEEESFRCRARADAQGQIADLIEALLPPEAP